LGRGIGVRMPIFLYRKLPVTLACALVAGCSSLPPTQTSNVGNSEIAWVRTGVAPVTVVFQSGLGDGMSPWSAVIDRLPPTVATFAYDRPGYGTSRPAPATPRSPCDVAQELHEALAAAGVRPPYLLVGHSIGGQYQYAYARLFPQEVAGMLLLDPTHPDHWTSLQRDTPVAAATISGLRATVFSSTMRAEFDGQSRCLDSAPPLTKRIPTRLLVSTRFDISESAALQSVVSRLRTDWLSKLSGSTLRPVEGAGHYIQRDKPDYVASEIRTVLNEISQSAP
jgi:pimeloyl-ACP methyl ester carboxylesterase